MTRIAVIYYSATGNVHALAKAVAEGAADEGAEVRLRHVAELPQEMLISFKQHWGRHRSELEDQTDAALADLEWGDGIAFGTPTRFGNVSAQLKVFLDLAGELAAREKACRATISRLSPGHVPVRGRGPAADYKPYTPQSRQKGEHR